MTVGAEKGGREPITWGKVIDNRKCIGCHACTVACKQEHDVPLGVNRTYVKQVEVGRYPNVRRHFQVHPLQPVRRRAVRGDMPHDGDVPTPGRHSGL